LSHHSATLRTAQQIPQPASLTPHHAPPANPQLFYIEDCGGDVKRALSAAHADAAWADTTAGPGIRTAPIQRWISGEAGL